MWQSVSLLTRRNDIVQTCYGIRNSNRQKAIDSLSGDFSFGKLVSSDHITISKDNCYLPVFERGIKNCRALFSYMNHCSGAKVAKKFHLTNSVAK